MPGLQDLDVGSKWLFSCAMSYRDAAMLCFDYATYSFARILSAAILGHKIVGSYSISRIIFVLLGDVGGDRRQF